MGEGTGVDVIIRWKGWTVWINPNTAEGKSHEPIATVFDCRTARDRSRHCTKGQRACSPVPNDVKLCYAIARIWCFNIH